MRQREASPPDWAVRLGLWFAIYLSAQVPMLWRAIVDGESYNLLAGPTMLPLALGMLVAIPLNLLPDAVSQTVGGPVMATAMVGSYLAYALNLIGVVRAKTRWRFSLLLLLEVGMVLLSQMIFWQMAHAISA